MSDEKKFLGGKDAFTQDNNARNVWDFPLRPVGKKFF